MISIVYDISQKSGSGIQIVEDHIDVAVIKEIAECCAAGGKDIGESTSSGRGHFLKFCAVTISKELGALGPSGTKIALVNNWINVAVGDEDVQETIIIEIEEARAPSQERNGRITKARFERDIGEIGRAIIAIER